MRQLFGPRTIVQFGLFLAFITVLGSLISRGHDFASIAYPPIPETHYKFIGDAVKRCNVPFAKRGLIAAIAWKESTFHPDSESGAGAVGVMQVLRGTGFGVANAHQIGGVNAATYTDPSIGYTLGTCYFADNVHNFGSGNPADYDNEKIVRAALIAYNAGPGRGQAFLDGSYNGPSSSLGYAERIIQASRVYSLDFARNDQQAATNSVDILQNVREIVWNVFLNPAVKNP